MKIYHNFLYIKTSWDQKSCFQYNIMNKNIALPISGPLVKNNSRFKSFKYKPFFEVEKDKKNETKKWIYTGVPFLLQKSVWIANGAKSEIRSIEKWSKIGNSKYWKVEQNRIRTRDHKFRRQIVWSKIGFSKKVHHVSMNSFKHFSWAKIGPRVLWPLYWILFMFFDIFICNIAAVYNFQ